MTIIVINAVSVREGGSLVVLRELLAAMIQLRPDWQWHVTTNAVARTSLPDHANVRFHVYSDQQLAGWRIRLWYETELLQLLKSTHATLLFSQTNYLPWRTLPCPSLLLVQHAGHFSELYNRLTEQGLPGWRSRWNWRLKGQWVRASVGRATRLTVQTAALAAEISQATGVPEHDISVIPHGCGLVTARNEVPSPPDCSQPIRIGYITKAGVQKNFAVVFAAAARLRQQGMDLRVVLTLDMTLSENRSVLALATQQGVDDLIENHGELPAAALGQLYRGLHCFVFASLCESFGFPMVEAMASGLPLLVADTRSNREVAGNAAEVFAPTAALDLAAMIQRLVKDPLWYRQLASRSLARAADFSWQQSAGKTVELIGLLQAATKAAAAQ